jgi:ankyrin repeat protein
MTPLYYAAESPNAQEIIKVLVEAGAQVDAISWNGESAIFAVVTSDDNNAVLALLRAGSSIKL